MIPKRLFIVTIVISLALHVLLIALTGFTGFSTAMPKKGDIFRVHLEKSPQPAEDEAMGEKPAPPGDEPSPQSEPARGTGQREDTVHLDSTDPRYNTYLMQLRERIESHWSYPFTSYLMKEEGTAIVKFAITEEGGLIRPHILESSGYTSLDAESVRAVSSSAPLPRLPENLNLSRLHIIAAFTYRITE